MPFTFAHPALVAPISKSRFGLSVTGLVIGSMIPDFEFIFRMKVGENIGHHWIGVLLFDVPFAFLLCLVFHQYIRDRLIENLPDWYQARFVRFVEVNWAAYARANKVKVLLSILLGIGTHLFWDAFTHHDGFFVELIPLLQRSVQFFQYIVPAYTLLQIASSVWGLWVVQSVISRLPVRQYMEADCPTYWPMITITAEVIFVVRLLFLPARHSFWDLFFAGMGSVIYALLAVSMLLRKRQFVSWQEQQP